MNSNGRYDRRAFLKAAAISSAVMVAGAPVLGLAEERRRGVKEVTPVEELMREHGALRRIFLIYEEALRRIAARQEMDPALVHEATTVVDRYIHALHERLEEDYLFPRMKEAGRGMDTVYVLIEQHRAGEQLTRSALRFSAGSHFRGQAELDTVASALSRFIRMYRPHAAWEDTTVFQEFKQHLTVEEHDRLGDLFQEKAYHLLGNGGFPGVIARIERIEDELGVSVLSEFSPKE